MGQIDNHRGGRPLDLDGAFLQSFSRTLGEQELDKALIAEALMLPGESYLADGMQTIDVDAIHEARQSMRRGLAGALDETLRQVYRANLSNEALLLRRRVRRSPQPEECVPVLPHGVRGSGGARLVHVAVSTGGQHDRRADLPRLVREHGLPGARASHRGVSPALEARHPGTGQVVQPAGHVALCRIPSRRWRN